MSTDLPEIWSDAVAPGGYVCAVPMPGQPDGICGYPVESEPCPKHGTDDTTHDESDGELPGMWEAADLIGGATDAEEAS